MLHTTNSAPFLSIDSSDLAAVQGGCGRRRCCRCSRSEQNVIINNIQPAPVVAAAPAPVPTTTASTSVSITQ